MQMNAVTLCILLILSIFISNLSALSNKMSKKRRRIYRRPSSIDDEVRMEMVCSECENIMTTQQIFMSQKIQQEAEWSHDLLDEIRSSVDGSCDEKEDQGHEVCKMFLDEYSKIVVKRMEKHFKHRSDYYMQEIDVDRFCTKTLGLCGEEHRSLDEIIKESSRRDRRRALEYDDYLMDRDFDHRRWRHRDHDEDGDFDEMDILERRLEKKKRARRRHLERDYDDYDDMYDDDVEIMMEKRRQRRRIERELERKRRRNEEL